MIQFPLSTPGPTEAEFGVLIVLEDELESISGDDYEVDGHDAGAGETNIFIITSDARAT